MFAIVLTEGDDEDPKEEDTNGKGGPGEDVLWIVSDHYFSYLFYL